MDPDLALFAKVVEAGSMSAAARSLQLSTPMVSKRIARLEQRLGTRLLDRTTRHLNPTPRGQRFYEDVISILDQLADAEERVAGTTLVPAGPLRLTAPTSFGRIHLAPRLKAFLDQYPAISLSLDLSDGFRDLPRDGFDVAIRITATPAANLVAHRLAENHRILCAAPAYLQQYGTPTNLSALGEHRLLAADGQMPWRLIDQGQLVRFSAESHVRTNSSEVVRELAIGGVGIALRSLWDVGEELQSQRLVRVLPTVQGSPDAGIYAVHARTNNTAAVSALIAYLKGISFGPDGQPD